MKKIFALLWISALCVGLLVYSLCSPTPQPNTAEPVTQPTDSVIDIVDNQPPQKETQLRILLPDPSKRAQWEQIAAAFSEKTGIRVVLLDSDRESAPTLFTVAGTHELAGRTCQDLSGTAAYAQLANMNLALSVEGKICGLAAEVECFGLIYNNDLLVAAGYTTGDISDIDGFSALVQGLSGQGYTAFSGRGLHDGVALRLASLPGNFRTLAQLWLDNAAKDTEGDALSRFMAGETVFYMGSTHEYAAITDGGVGNLGILPIYLDDRQPQTQSLCVTAKSYWCISSEDPAEVAAATAFLDYLVMADDSGAVPVDLLEILAPYRQATYHGNPLEAVFRQDLIAGKSYLVCSVTEQVPAGFVDALMVFTQDPTEENWSKVEMTLGKKGGA